MSLRPLPLALLLSAAILAPPALADFGLRPFTTVPMPSWPDAVAVGDVTGDGLDDVVITTSSYFSPEFDYHLFLFRQQDDGSLAAPVSFRYGEFSNRTSLAIVDLNGDRFGDVIVGHGGGLALFLSDREGGFGIHQVPAEHDVTNVAVLDVNRDGLHDVVGQSWSRGATIFLGDGAGGMAPHAPLATRAQGYNDVAVGDLDDDGIDDLVVMSGQGFEGAEVLLHDGVSGFRADTSYFGDDGERLSAVVAGDLNGDGRDDLAFGHPINSPTRLWLRHGNGQGGLGPAQTLPTLDIPGNALVRDMDGDGRQDLLVLHDGWENVGIYRQGANGALAPEVLFPAPTATLGPDTLAVGDINNDGCRDVAMADYNYGLVRLEGQDCVLPPTADLRLDLTLSEGLLVLRVSNVGGAATSAAPLLRVRLAPRQVSMVLRALPPGCRMAPAWSRGTTVECLIPDLDPGQIRETLLGYSLAQKPPLDARLGVSAMIVPTTFDPKRTNNSVEQVQAFWRRRLDAPVSAPAPSARPALRAPSAPVRRAR